MILTICEAHAAETSLVQLPVSRKRMTEGEIAKLRELPDEAKRLSVLDKTKSYEDYQITAEALKFWTNQYELLTGTKPRVVGDLVQLVRDHGDFLLSLYERPYRIGITTFSGRKFDQAESRQLFGAILRALRDQGIPLQDVALVSGLTNLGGVEAAYDASDRHPEIEKQGLAAAKAIIYPVAQVDKALLLGTSFGSESPVFLDAINFLIVLGGGNQAGEEARKFLKRTQDRTIIVQEFFEIKTKDGVISRVPGAADLLPPELGGKRFSGGVQNPMDIGKNIGEEIARTIKAGVIQNMDFSLKQIAMSKAGVGALDLEAWARTAVSNYRVIRITNAVVKKLKKTSISEAQINQLTHLLLQNLSTATTGIDNFASNSEWSAAAQSTVSQVLAGVAGAEHIASEIDKDVKYASELGTQPLDAQLTYFDTAATKLSPASSRLPSETKLDDYVELRVDLITQSFLMTSPIEIFVGTSDEMIKYYSLKRLPQTQRLQTFNGTTFWAFGEGQNRRVVIHGVDSQARLTHIASILNNIGIDLNQVIQRGEIERVRKINALDLEVYLSELKLPIAGYVLGNNWLLSKTLHRMAGLSEEQIKKSIRSHSVGPFKFESIVVRPHGSQQDYLLLNFAIAYGDLSEDLVESLDRVGALNGTNAGPGGSVGPHVAGQVQHIEKVVVGDRTIDFKALKNVRISQFPFSSPAGVNRFSPTPIEQDPNWLQQSLEQGVTTTDQEFGPIALALEKINKRIAEAGNDRFVTFQPSLYQSAPAGNRQLDGGTYDAKYDETVSSQLLHFYQGLGLSHIKLGDTYHPIPESHPGFIAEQIHEDPSAGSISVSSVNAGQSIASIVLSSLDQIRGEKRIIEIETLEMSNRERKFLDLILRTLPPHKFWIVVKESDPHHGEILDKAHMYGFETIGITSKPQLQRVPTLAWPVENAEGEKVAFDEFIRDGSKDEYEAIPAIHRRIYLGDKTIEGLAPNHFSTASLQNDDIEDLAQTIRREPLDAAKALKTRIIENFKARGKEPPRFYDIDDLDRALNRHLPVLVSGASKKAWGTISEPNQKNIDEDQQILWNAAQEYQVMAVTGGTQFGVEEITHREVDRKDIPVLGTITETTKPEEIADNVKAVILMGINWYGKSRGVLHRIMRPYNGPTIFVGGGKILAEEIALAAQSGIQYFTMKGPEGAANDATERVPARGFLRISDILPKLFANACAKSVAALSPTP